MDITVDMARRVRDVVAAGSVHGIGKPGMGTGCVEAAVCFALGLPHGDGPGCVSPSLRRLKIGLNDARWSTNEARTNGLKRLALAQLGSQDVLDDAEFRRRVIEMTIRRSVPAALRAAASVNPKHAEQLEAAAVRCELEGTREAAWRASDAARNAVAYPAAYAAAYVAAFTAASAASDASASASAASDAAAYVAAFTAASAASDASASASAAASAASDAAASACDKSLATYAEWVVDILIDMDAPGCQWLPLLDEVA